MRRFPVRAATPSRAQPAPPPQTPPRALVPQPRTRFWQPPLPPPVVSLWRSTRARVRLRLNGRVTLERGWGRLVSKRRNSAPTSRGGLICALGARKPLPQHRHLPRALNHELLQLGGQRAAVAAAATTAAEAAAKVTLPVPTHRAHLACSCGILELSKRRTKLCHLLVSKAARLAYRCHQVSPRTAEYSGRVCISTLLLPTGLTPSTAHLRRRARLCLSEKHCLAIVALRES